MSEQSATATTLPHRGIRGAVTVGDYLDAPAAGAVRAVRRVGLCPGLDRQFGGEPQSIGLVVAQDPQAGSELARGAIVTLYVSAPAAGVSEESQEQTLLASDEQEYAGETVLDGSFEPEAAPGPTVSANARPVRRRRKRRARPPATGRHGLPQAPIPAATPHPELIGEHDEESAPVGEQEPEASTADTEPSLDQLTFEMRNVFETGPLGLGRRSLYPRKPLTLRVHGWLTWLRAHKAIALAVSALLALTMSLTVTRERTATSKTAGPIERSAPPARPSTSPRRAPARSRQQVPTTREHRRTHAEQRSRAHSRAATRPPPPKPSAAVGAGPEVSPQTGSAASAPVSQSGGGPFSP